MSFFSYLYAVLFYCATVTMVVGVGRKIRIYAKTPAPLKIPTTPAPTTRSGVVGRMIREVVFFESLFKSSKWTWLFGWAFHFGLLLALIRHLRYFTEPVWSWVAFLQSAGVYAGYAMVFGLLGLWGRRLLVDRVRYISAPSDHLMLALILGIAGSGLLMKYIWHTDVVALKTFALGLLWFDWAPLPDDPILLIHLGLVICLMFVFPISKLLHVPGLFFSPTRNQADDPRERRHYPGAA
ncbi:MAG: nitrate reductase [Gammaproteobacteria bacterium]|nr:nitrate reductase [Gammaproteobacteria bacterium]NKB63998.1 nitrate reductase [Gammaproteobacteria bacterium]